MFSVFTFFWLYRSHRYMLQIVLYICAQIQGNIQQNVPLRRLAKILQGVNMRTGKFHAELQGNSSRRFGENHLYTLKFRH